MVKKSLIVVFLITLVYFCIQLFLRPLLANALFSQIVSFVYLWSPGIVAFFFARKEGKPLKVLAKPNKSFWLIPVYTILIAAVAFLIAIPFGAGEAVNQAFVGQPMGKVIGLVILFFFTSYLLVALLFSFVFLGGELYWRGYLWDSLKKIGPLKAMGWIALFWSLWQVPITALTYTPGASMGLNILLTFVLNFALTPALVYARVKGKSIYSAALFYSSLMSAFLFFMLLFPSTNMRVLAVYGGLTIVVLIVFSLVFKLYSAGKWNQLLNEKD